MIEPVLVILAAGLGSRFGGGGLKQVTPVGPSGERIIDYSLYDAYRAGFRRAVCVIKEEMLEEFQQEISRPAEGKIQIEYAFQRLEDIPAPPESGIPGAEIPAGREKPWGTGHAALTGAMKVREVWGDAPYAAINADDFYGRKAYEEIYQFLTNPQRTDLIDMCMVSYQVGNTVTDNGSVSRGVCQVTDGMLRKVTERTQIEKLPEGKVGYTEDQGESWTILDPQTPVSMQFWGCTAGFTDALEQEFARFFFEDLPKNPLKGEFYLPFAVDAMVQDGRAQVHVLESADKWYGVTYLVDRQSVIDAVAAMTEEGKYYSPVWGQS